MSGNAKTHIEPPTYFYNYIRLGINEGKIGIANERAKLIFDATNTDTETMALTVSDADSYKWVHMIHTLTSSDNSVTINRAQRSGVIDLKVSGQSSTSNASCYSGEITANKLNSSGKCWLDVMVDPSADYWTVHVYKQNGQEINPNIKVELANNGKSHLCIDFSSIDIFNDMMAPYNSCYVKVLVIDSDVSPITIAKVEYDEPIQIIDADSSTI